jgi:hypothetical protein
MTMCYHGCEDDQLQSIDNGAEVSEEEASGILPGLVY